MMIAVHKEANLEPIDIQYRLVSKLLTLKVGLVLTPIEHDKQCVLLAFEVLQDSG